MMTTGWYSMWKQWYISEFYTVHCRTVRRAVPTFYSFWIRNAFAFLQSKNDRSFHFPRGETQEEESVTLPVSYFAHIYRWTTHSPLSQTNKGLKFLFFLIHLEETYSHVSTIVVSRKWGSKVYLRCLDFFFKYESPVWLSKFCKKSPCLENACGICSSLDGMLKLWRRKVFTQHTSWGAMHWWNA
jgi:hypothetical protein